MGEGKGGDGLGEIYEQKEDGKGKESDAPHHPLTLCTHLSSGPAPFPSPLPHPLLPLPFPSTVLSLNSIMEP